MAEWSKTEGLNGGFTHTLNVTVASQDVASNTSVVTVVYSITKNNLSTTTGSPTWSVAVNGVPFGGTASVNMTNGQRLVLLATQLTVAHEADGSKSFTAGFAFAGISDYCPAVSQDYAVTLTTIPRKSDFTLPTFTAGSAGTITISPASSSLTHTVVYSFGDSSGTLATKTSSTSVSWTPPVSILTNMPNSTSSPGGWVSVETFNGSTSLGTVVKTLTIMAGADAIPSIGTVTLTEAASAVKTLFGSSAGAKFVQGVSSIQIPVTGAAGYQGSTVTKIEASLGDGASTSVSAASGTLTLTPTSSGSLTLTITVTDTRGRYRTATQTVTVLAYAPPSVTSVTAKRSNSSGTLTEDGTSIRVDYAESISSLKPASTELNKLTITIAMAASGGTTFTTDKTVSVSGLSASSYATSSKSTYAVDSSWSVLVTFADKLTSSQALLTISVAQVFMHWDGSDGVGIGKYREKGSLDLAGDAYARGGLLDPPGIVVPYAGSTAPDGWLLCDGSYYSKTAYAALYAAIGTAYGATSTTFAVPDLRARIPVGRTTADTSLDTLGETGGEKTHTLTVDEMPAHAHQPAGGGYFHVYGQGGGDSVGSSGGFKSVALTSSVGGGAAHNNMPPYLVLNYLIRA